MLKLVLYICFKVHFSSSNVQIRHICFHSDSFQSQTIKYSDIFFILILNGINSYQISQGVKSDQTSQDQIKSEK